MTQANYTGNTLQQFVEARIAERGYTFIPNKKFGPARYFRQPIYSKQFYVGQSIYNTNLFCDYILYHPDKHADSLIIEAKWQQSGGSVDEKYPYLLLNIQYKYPHPTVLVLDGSGNGHDPSSGARDGPAGRGHGGFGHLRGHGGAPAGAPGDRGASCHRQAGWAVAVRPAGR